MAITFLNKVDGGPISWSLQHSLKNGNCSGTSNVILDTFVNSIHTNWPECLTAIIIMKSVHKHIC